MLEQDKIIKVDINNEMTSSYRDYAMSVIVSRALPDVRDGFKPVHRRVIYGMDKLGNYSNAPHKKSVRIVGDVLGKFHPHGDSSVYGAMVRMAQDWSMRYPLIDGQGNFGSVDDGPAAMRYTEARLDKMGEEMIRDIDEDTVDFVPNFDNTDKEPVVLPTRFPNLLVNGASGIAVGMATNMPPHNLNESVNAAIALLENPDIDVNGLMQHISAPDFPTGGIIYGVQGVRDAFETGRGRIIIRAKAEIERIDNHDAIIIKELPYCVVKKDLVAAIANLANEKKIEGISDIRDLSNKEGIRVEIELKKDANANVILTKLYKMTLLQSSFSVNNIALVNGRPQTLNLKQILQHFIDHRYEVVRRRSAYKRKKAQDRVHIIEGLIIASDNIDEVVRIIKTSANNAEAKIALGERFNLDDEQTQAIVDMRLGQLTGLVQEKLHAELEELLKFIAEMTLILTDDNVCRGVIKDELLEVVEKFGDERKTVIEQNAEEVLPEDFYADDDMIITISHMGYIKRTPLREYRAQHRGGVGAKGSDTRDEDFIEYIYPASMHNYMLFFTQKGRCYWLRVFQIPEGAKNSKGRAIQNVLQIAADDKVNTIICTKKLADAEYINSHNLVFITKNGIIKKTSLAAYSHVRSIGVNAIIIREDDKLIDVALTDGDSEIIIANKYGKAIRFHESKVREMGRMSTGVKAMTLDNADDEIIGMVTMKKDSQNEILTVSENGYGKRSVLDEYRITNRGGKGIKTLNITEKTGKLVAIKSVNNDNDLVIINKSGIAIRMNVETISVSGRNTQGVRLINLDKKGDEIASVCKVDKYIDEEEEIVDAEGSEGVEGVAQNETPTVTETGADSETPSEENEN